MSRVLEAYELYDVAEEVARRLQSDQILEMLAYANRAGNLPAMLEAMGFGDILGDDAGRLNKKILVISDGMMNEGKLKAIIRENSSLDVSCFEFFLDYNGQKHYNFDKLRYSETYAAVILGPGPHSTPGARDASSVITNMQAHPEIYPRVIVAEDLGGSLKLTKSSFIRALGELEG